MTLPKILGLVRKAGNHTHIECHQGAGGWITRQIGRKNHRNIRGMNENENGVENRTGYLRQSETAAED